MKSIIFLITLLGINLFGQDTLTIREVFNYNIGDEFHYRDGGNPSIDMDYLFESDYQLIKIIDKEYFLERDSLVYTQIVTDCRFPKGIDVKKDEFYIIKVDTQVVSFVEVDSSIRDYDPYYNIDTSNVDTSFIWKTYIRDTVFQIPEYLCNTLINGVEYLISWGEYDYRQRFYGKGLGLVYSSTHYHNDGPGYFYRELNYYKKGDKSCGQKFITSTSQNHEIDAVIIFPNPVIDKMNFEMGNHMDNILISIIDMQGKLIYTSWISSTKPILDISDLSSGIYFVRYELREKIIVEKIIKH